MRDGVALESDEALEAAFGGFRQMVAYFARREDSDALNAPISTEAQLAEQVAAVLAISAARGTAPDRKLLRETYEFVYGIEFRRTLVLAAVTRSVEQLTSGALSLDDAWTRLRSELVALDELFARAAPEAMKAVLSKTRLHAKGAGNFSTAKAAASLCLASGALGATRRERERTDAARTRIAKSFRSAVSK